MNSKHVFLDSKKRGKVNRLVQTFSTCSFLAPVSPGRVPPADPKRAAPPDSSQLCSSKDSPSPSCSVLTRTSRLPSLSCPLGKPYSSPLLAEISFCQLHTRCVSLFMFFIKSKLVDFFHLLLKQSCRRCSSLVAALVRDMVATFGKCSETRLLPTIVLHCYSVIPTIGHLTTAGRALPMDWLSSVALQSLHVAEHTVLKHTLC